MPGGTSTQIVGQFIWAFKFLFNFRGIWQTLSNVERMLSEYCLILLLRIYDVKICEW